MMQQLLGAAADLLGGSNESPQLKGAQWIEIMKTRKLMKILATMDLLTPEMITAASFCFMPNVVGDAKKLLGIIEDWVKMTRGVFSAPNENSSASSQPPSPEWTQKLRGAAANGIGHHIAQARAKQISAMQQLTPTIRGFVSLEIPSLEAKGVEVLMALEEIEEMRPVERGAPGSDNVRQAEDFVAARKTILSFFEEFLALPLKDQKTHLATFARQNQIEFTEMILSDLEISEAASSQNLSDSGESLEYLQWEHPCPFCEREIWGLGFKRPQTKDAACSKCYLLAVQTEQDRAAFSAVHPAPSG